MKQLIGILGSLLGLLGMPAYGLSTFTKEHYSHIRQEGRVEVECNDSFNTSFGSFYCKASYLDPSNSEFFQTKDINDYHHVTLKIENAKGTDTDQWHLNPFTGKTFYKLSLWGTGGLLALGENTIHYSVENSDDHVLESGVFKTTVDEPPTRQCSTIWVRSFNTFDCQTPEYACRQLMFPRSECTSTR